MLRQTLAKWATYSLSDSCLSWVTCWSEIEDVAIGLLSINRVMNFEHRVSIECGMSQPSSMATSSTTWGLFLWVWWGTAYSALLSLQRKGWLGSYKPWRVHLDPRSHHMSLPLATSTCQGVALPWPERVKAFHICFQLNIEARSQSLLEQDLLVDFSRDPHNLSLICCVNTEYDLGLSLRSSAKELWITLSCLPWSTLDFLRIITFSSGWLSSPCSRSDDSCSTSSALRAARSFWRSIRCCYKVANSLVCLPLIHQFCLRLLSASCMLV